MTANTVQSRKQKGRQAQQLVKTLIEANNPELLPGDVRSTSMGNSGEDIQFSPRARDMIPFSIEVKNVEKLNFWAAWEQALEHVKKTKGVLPLVCFRKSRQPMIAALEAKEFFKILRKAYLYDKEKK